LNIAVVAHAHEDQRGSLAAWFLAATTDTFGMLGG
jgi:hypothetical protein